MPQQRKIFRIEEHLQADALPTVLPGSGEDMAALRHHELMTELAALRGLLGSQSQATPGSVAAGQNLAASSELKTELDLIYEAIRFTEEEVTGLETGNGIVPDATRPARELAAVMTDTEQATQRILTAAEDIDQAANTLSTLLDGYAHGLAQDIRDSVVKIFEACNFQDLSGQRITKAIATLQRIEDRIARLRQIWSRIESAAPSAPSIAPLPRQSVDRTLLNGPKLPGDPGHFSQDDIDRIFDSN